MGAFSGAAAKPSNQWAQLAHFFPEDSKAGAGFKGKGGTTDWAGILSALGTLGQQQQAPQAPEIQFSPMPGPQYRDLLNAPRMAQGQLMPAPAAMAPYMWGGR